MVHCVKERLLEEWNHFDQRAAAEQSASGDSDWITVSARIEDPLKINLEILNLACM